jgi:hypothetical protein
MNLTDASLIFLHLATSLSTSATNLIKLASVMFDLFAPRYPAWHGVAGRRGATPSARRYPVPWCRKIKFASVKVHRCVPSPRIVMQIVVGRDSPT